MATNKRKSNISNDLISSLVFDSIKLLMKNPILVVPKLLIAFLYGITTLYVVGLSKELLSLQSLTTEQLLNIDFNYFFIAFCILLVLTVLTFFIDIIFMGFYPILISLAQKGKLSFKEAFKLFKPKLFSVLFTGLILWILVVVISIIEASVILYFNLSSIGFVLSFFVAFILIFVFYFVYPKVVFEGLKVKKTFFESFSVSLKNKKLVFVLSLIPFFVSILKFILAYFPESLLFLVLFWILVILTGLTYSVHITVNQLAYSKISNSKK